MPLSTDDEFADLLDGLVTESRKVLAVEGTAAETSLYGPFETFLRRTVSLLAPGGASWIFIGQPRANDVGIPDFRANKATTLKGWVELKAVVGKDLGNLQGHDKRQKERFVAGLDNVIYTTGWQWELYRHGQQIGRTVVLGPSSMFDPNGLPYAVQDAARTELRELIENFAAAPGQSFTRAADAVRALAFRAKALKLALTEVGEAGAGQHLAALRSDFRALLYRNGLPFTWERFVDSYVQLATFGVLLWRLETGQTISLGNQVGIQPNMHPLLAQCLSILWQPASQPAIVQPLLEELCITVNDIDPALFASSSSAGKRKYITDPIVHAYEPFFQQYDPAAREAAGVFYTPTEIVAHIIDGIEDLLVSSLGRPDGLLDEHAKFLDPATGTGTFLLGLASAVAEAAQNAGLPADQMVKEVMTTRASAFELFPGPYTVAHQRLEVALKGFGATLTDRLPIYLADTLAAPESGTLGGSGFGLAGVEIKKEREEADKVKTAQDILVILGNPPYERIRQSTGGGFEPFASSLLEHLKTATPLDYRADLKSTRDLFVAFWLWSLWALQPPPLRLGTADAPTLKPQTDHGIIGFITNRTWISGRSLVGLRRLFRRGAKEIWVCDLGGDNRGAHGAKSWAGGDANVFGIQTGVAIVWGVFDRDYDDQPTVYYRRMYGKKPAKLGTLASGFARGDFEVIGGEDIAPFLPNRWGNSPLATSPRLSELFAIQPETGNLTSRDTKTHSPIGVRPADVYAVTGGKGGATVISGSLGEWSKLGSNKRAEEWHTAQSKRSRKTPPDPSQLSESRLRSYAYRPLDFRTLYDDDKWIDWPRPTLREVYGNDKRVWALVTIPKDQGRGPAAIHVDRLMDQHVYNRRGAKGVYYLWRPYVTGHVLPDARTVVRDGQSCTFSKMVYDWLDDIGRNAQVENAYDYILAVLSAPSYTADHWQALENDTLRVPLTHDPALFDQAAALGAQLREAWTLDLPRDPAVSWGGSSSSPLGSLPSRAPSGALTFGNGRTLSGVTTDVWEWEVSGFRVLREWWKPRLGWMVTVSEAKEAIAVVSAIRRFLHLAGQLDGTLAAALGSAKALVAATDTAPLDVVGDESDEDEDDEPEVGAEDDEATLLALLDEPSIEPAPDVVLAPLSDAPLEYPAADIEVDFDVEFDERQQVYLWGVLVTDRVSGGSTYQAIGSPEADFDEQALAQGALELFTETLTTAEAASKSVHFFHYGSVDRQQMERLLGTGALPMTSRMDDLLSLVRKSFESSAGYGLKTLAAEAGYQWQSDGMTGADTYELIAAARAGDTAAWETLIAYNEDDTRAAKALRDYLVARDG